MTDTMTQHDITAQLRSLSPEAVTQARVDAINAGRSIGMTWRTIAESLNMTQTGIQRIPGVRSPWNERKGQA